LKKVLTITPPTHWFREITETEDFLTSDVICRRVNNVYEIKNEGKNTLLLMYEDEIELNSSVNTGAYKHMWRWSVIPASLPRILRSNKYYWSELMAVPAVLVKEYDGVDFFLKTTLKLTKKSEFGIRFKKLSPQYLYVHFSFNLTRFRFYGLVVDLEAKHKLTGMKLGWAQANHWSHVCDFRRKLNNNQKQMIWSLATKETWLPGKMLMIMDQKRIMMLWYQPVFSLAHSSISY